MNAIKKMVLGLAAAGAAMASTPAMAQGRFVRPIGAPAPIVRTNVAFPAPVRPTPVPDSYLHKKVNPYDQNDFRQAVGFQGRVLPEFGMRVDAVVPYSAAQRLGLKPGDVIVSVNGQLVASNPAFAQAVSNAQVYGGGYVQCVIRDVRTGRRLVAGTRL